MNLTTDRAHGIAIVRIGESRYKKIRSPVGLNLHGPAGHAERCDGGFGKTVNNDNFHCGER